MASQGTHSRAADGSDVPQDKYQWTDTQQKAFDQMKAVMAHTVELAFPTYGDPFHIYTDASGYQLGAVITQHDRPLAFWSKKCNESQRKYPANRLELLSILLLLREYRTMILGPELHIHTDHLNLTYGTFNNIQMMRWRLEIEEFGPHLQFIKGENNVVADALSRLPGVPGSDLGKGEAAVQLSAAEVDNAVLFSLSLRQLALAQESAVGLGGVPKEINGVKLRVEPKSGCIVVPNHLQAPVMRAYHEWLMNPGGAAMYQTMKTSLWWKSMEAHIIRYVRNCLACAKSKHPTVKYGKLPAKTVVMRPWFEVAIDSIGPYGKK
ncbi:hypothetical protein PF008_g3789 [Phytophthora fragariae]|uniref:Integrase zinc-binding domain-containing protein n=1 Tax=Phytophthora fragariae TaxID=53985 RepID=A0A6G0SEA3_9STRA|nr:hypothetical protein PF008_g3789 [Phytophthora fragariae]